jgi:hypothetical protein
MAGQTIDEVHAAQHAAKPHDNQTYKPRTPNQNTHITTSTAPTAPDMSATGTIFVNGLPYVPDTMLWTNPLEFRTANLTYLCTCQHYTLLRRAMSLEYLRRDTP